MIGEAPLAEGDGRCERSAPDDEKDVVSQATIGQVVSVLETQGGLSRIETPDRYPGWIATSALIEYKDASVPRYASRGRVAEVVSLMANIPRDADLQFDEADLAPLLVRGYARDLTVLDRRYSKGRGETRAARSAVAGRSEPQGKSPVRAGRDS